MNHKVTMNRITAITNVRIFDGECVLNDTTVVINGAHIQSVGGVAPTEATVIDGRGATLMPSLIDAHVFIIPTLVTLSTAFGNNAAKLAADQRVRSRLSRKWLDSLSRCMDVYPQGKLEDAYANIRALCDAGVDILAGSDVSEPIPILGGLAHGASLHHELQLLVAAGLKPIEALRAATSTPARRFGLTDRGRIVPGTFADLLLVDGDPLINIADTLSIRAVWHRGVEFTT